MRSHFDVHAPILYDRLVGPDGHHARGTDDLARPDVEAALMKIALDDVAVDKTLGHRSRPVRAGVVGHAEFPLEVVNGQNQVPGYHLAHFAGFDILNLAEFNPRRHNPTQYTGRSKVRPLPGRSKDRGDFDDAQERTE